MHGKLITGMIYFKSTKWEVHLICKYDNVTMNFDILTLGHSRLAENPVSGMLLLVSKQVSIKRFEARK